MIIPSIDLMNGQTVQLVGGKEDSLRGDRQYGDPLPLARKFRLAGEIAVIDLDAALGKGSNAPTINGLLREARCRVGGGIRSAERAIEWLDAGAAKVILGTAAKPEILRQLPRERVIAALDANAGDVVVEGWTKSTGAKIVDRIAELRDLVGGFLVTFVEREGRMQGTNMELAAEVVKAAGKHCRVTIAGGVTTAEEIAELDRLGADAQVGMAIYTGQLDLGDAIAAPLISDRPDGLFATVVCDEAGRALGLAYSNRESLRKAVELQAGVYWSRKRGLWIKGASSGSTQKLFSIALDCDRDAIRFIVEQKGSGYCHLPQWTCFGDDRGVSRLERTLAHHCGHEAHGMTDTNSQKLLADPALLSDKIREEANGLANAKDRAEVVREAADLIYHTMVRLSKDGIAFDEVEAALDARSLRVTGRD
jgi:phosphoribosyl-ATP pyrophosphohydrolase